MALNMNRIDFWMYQWSVEMAHVWELRGDIDGYCHWRAWRIDERWNEVERVEYEAWKYAQLSEINKLSQPLKTLKSYQKPRKLTNRRKG